MFVVCVCERKREGGKCVSSSLSGICGIWTGMMCTNTQCVWDMIVQFEPFADGRHTPHTAGLLNN